MGEVVYLPDPPADPDPAAGPVTITAPGVYPPDVVPLADYIADPVPGGSLSASGARMLLPPSCPARFRWWADHPEDRRDSDAYDFGTAVHTMVTGVGPPHITITARNRDGDPVTDWRTKAAQEEAEAIRQAGGIPMLLKNAERVVAAVDALYAHPQAWGLFDCPGTPEATMVWADPTSGVWCRSRPDRLPDPGPGRLIVPDLKTCERADRRACERAMFDFGYDLQGAMIVDGLAALDIADDAAFVLVFVERTPPYLVTVAEPDWDALDAGRADFRDAAEVYAGCVGSGRWPGYADGVMRLRRPRWARYRYNDEED